MLPAPPGPFRPGFWRSPLRGPWLTSALGSILLVLIAIVATTGFLSHAAYMPDLGRNAIVPKDRDLPLDRVVLRLADEPELAVRAHAGPAHQRRPDRDPVPAGEAVVGHPAAVRVPAGQEPGAGDRAALDRAAGLERGVRAGHGRDERAVLVPVQVQLRRRALLRRDRLRRLAGAARDRQAAGDREGLPRARGAQAAARRPRPHQAGAARRGRPRHARIPPSRRSRAAGCSPSPARVRACCWSPTSASRSADRCASSRSWRRGGRSSPGDFPINKRAAQAGSRRR